MMSAPALRRGLAAMVRRPELNVPIMMCPKCKRRPMAIKKVHQSWRSDGAADVELICPVCKVTVTVPSAQE